MVWQPKTANKQTTYIFRSWLCFISQFGSFFLELYQVWSWRCACIQSTLYNLNAQSRLFYCRNSSWYMLFDHLSASLTQVNILFHFLLQLLLSKSHSLKCRQEIPNIKTQVGINSFSTSFHCVITTSCPNCFWSMLSMGMSLFADSLLSISACITMVWHSGISSLSIVGCVTKMCRLKFAADIALCSLLTILSYVQLSGKGDESFKPFRPKHLFLFKYDRQLLGRPFSHIVFMLLPQYWSLLKQWLLPRVITVLTYSFQRLLESLEYNNLCLALPLSWQRPSENIIEYPPNDFLIVFHQL